MSVNLWRQTTIQHNHIMRYVMVELVLACVMVLLPVRVVAVEPVVMAAMLIVMMELSAKLPAEVFVPVHQQRLPVLL
jgi:heme/copper-type cytochrome/quinol oxidase subunit 4